MSRYLALEYAGFRLVFLTVLWHVTIMETNTALKWGLPVPIFNSQNDWSGQVGIEYLIVGMIGLGGLELNIW